MILGYRLQATRKFVDWQVLEASCPDFHRRRQFCPKSHQEKLDITQFIVAGYIHVEFEGITRHDFGPGEKNMAIRGRKMVKESESGSEITKAHAWTPYKPNIFSLTASSLTFHIMAVHEGIPKADRGAGVKKWTVIGGGKGQFRRYWHRRRSFWYDFESLTTRRLQRRLELNPLQKACPQATNKI